MLLIFRYQQAIRKYLNTEKFPVYSTSALHDAITCRVYMSVSVVRRRREERVDLAELPSQSNQEQTEPTGTSPQASHYTSLINPGATCHDYTEVTVTRMPRNQSAMSNQQQHPPMYSNVSSQGSLNTMPQQVGDYIALISRPEAHGYAELTRPEKSSTTKSASNHKQCSKVHSTVVRRDSKKVTVKFSTSDSDPLDVHQIENPAVVDGKRDLAVKNTTSRLSSRNVRSAPTDQTVQESATYCTVVRQGGEKVTIRIQAPTGDQESW